MDFGVFELFTLLGALGLFIYGMKIMSEGIQKAAGSRLRQILGAMTQNRYFGVLTGFFITALVQSSSVTTVMTVSFVNAGLLSLVESAGVMMGANIGTTITGWLVTSLGLGKVKIAVYALPIIAIGLPMLFVRKGNVKHWGQFLIGFAILFMGLSFLKKAVPDIRSNPEVLEFLANYANMGVLTTLLFIGVGTLLTIVIQSSSAAMALTLVMCSQGWIPFHVAAPMVLGENIGTTITAEIASLVGNVHAKRSARIHSMFNIIGVFWMILALPWFLDGIDWVVTGFFGEPSPYDNSDSIPLALSAFHTIFNFTNVLVLIGFVPLLVKVATRTVKSKGEDDEKYTLEFITSSVTDTTELSLLEARNQVAKFGELTQKMHSFSSQLLVKKGGKEDRVIHERIAKYEDITDRVEVEIADYLLKASGGEMSDTSSLRVRSMLSIIGDLERIGDIVFQMSKSFERKSAEKFWFTPEQRNNLSELFSIVDQAIETMVENLNQDYEKVDLAKANDLEDQINKTRKKIRKEHVKSVESGDYNIRSGMIYADLYNSAEKLGDHIINVSEAIVGQA